MIGRKPLATAAMVDAFGSDSLAVAGATLVEIPFPSGPAVAEEH